MVKPFRAPRVLTRIIDRDPDLAGLYAGEHGDFFAARLDQRMEPLCGSRPIGQGGLAGEQFAFGYAKGVGQRDQVAAPRHRPAAFPRPDARLRSEEHTSELQSLMRISYAVFCLKKKTVPQQQKVKTTINTLP